MKLLLSKIAIVFTALLLVAATGGYSVFRHYCSCEDRVIASIFMEATCEHDRIPAEQACCATNTHEKSCCTANTQKDGRSHHHSANCCHTNAQFLKISDSFNSGQYTAVEKICPAVLTLTNPEISADEHSAFYSSLDYSDTSPPLSGREILLQHHQLKLAPELG